MIIDLHVHTTIRSADSSLTPEELLREARRIGLGAVCLAEHSGLWDRFELQRFVGDGDGILLVPAMEIDTDLGHVIVIGLDRYTSGAATFRDLRRIADNTGAYLVLAHPFRHMLHKSPYNTNLLYRNPALYPATAEEATTHPVLQMVDAIEVANGGTSKDENIFAWEVAQLLGKPMVGGSDAHSVHGFGGCVTVFPDRISSAQEFLEALRANDFYPATGLNVGNLQPFGDGQGPGQTSNHL